MSVIELNNIWEMYRIKFIIDGKSSWDNFWALRDISFSVEKGEVLGIIGENGAGKSTVLKLIAGMIKPDRGVLNVSGRVSGLLELGAGFQPELTGRENIYLSCGMFGLSKEETDAVVAEIIEFADIGKFIHAPVKCYSQGMFVRLAFAVAIHVKPDILLIDDTLAVGDEYFQRKCIRKIFELKESGMTIICVSHGIEMLRRLCRRAVLLKDGRVVKDGAFETVVPLYTQLVGSREGVGILQECGLQVVFNNGKMFLGYKEVLLTAGSGVYANFLISDKWYSSPGADWKVKKTQENKLVAEGKFYQLEMTQVWVLEVLPGNQLKIDIEIKSEGFFVLQEGFFTATLTDGYARWFTDSEKGEFPLIKENSHQWYPLLEGSGLNKFIGVISAADESVSPPSLLFEQISAVRQAQIFNTDYLTHCRVIQCRMLNSRDHSENEGKGSCYFSGKINFDIPQIEQYMTKVKDESALVRGDLRLEVRGGRALLYWKGVELTKRNHVSTLVRMDGKLYFSNTADWKVSKEGENRLVAVGKWEDSPLSQVWKIGLSKDSSILWTVENKVEQAVNIEEQFLVFMFSESYNYWLSCGKQGRFPDVFSKEHMDMLQRCIVDDVIGIQSEDERFPSISLKLPATQSIFGRVLNSDLYQKARMVNVEKIEPEANVQLPPGQHHCFSIELSLSEAKEKIIYERPDTLEDGRLKVVFDSGKACIYWGGVQLTKKLSFYTSIRSQSRWYDSASWARWNIEDFTKNAISARGEWRYLPVYQSWNIRLIEENTIEYRIKMTITDKIEIDRMQVNLMLSENYAEWILNRQKGVFSPFKSDIDDDWEVLCSQAAGADRQGCIGALKNCHNGSCLPEVKLSPQHSQEGWHLNIINSDLFHRGRVLQHVKKDKTVLLPGEYAYGEGRITIEGH